MRDDKIDLVYLKCLTTAYAPITISIFTSTTSITNRVIYHRLIVA